MPRASVAVLSAGVSAFLAKHLSQYDVENILGRGTYGVVFSGVRSNTGDGNSFASAAAIKIQKVLPEFIEDFEEEVKCHQELQKSDHPNILKIWGIFHDPTGHSAAMIMEAGSCSLLQMQRSLSTQPSCTAFICNRAG